jgi:hypothetical protein
MANSRWCGLALSAALATGSPASQTLAAELQSASAAVAGWPSLPALDDELWAGVSYRDALVGAVVLGSGAAVVSFLTGSTASAVTAAVAVAITYVAYDPGSTGVMSPRDLPTLPELSKRMDKG